MNERVEAAVPWRAPGRVGRRRVGGLGVAAVGGGVPAVAAAAAAAVVGHLVGAGHVGGRPVKGGGVTRDGATVTYGLLCFCRLARPGLAASGV